MVGGICCCLDCPGSDTTGGDSDRDPVLLISGIGGSILNAKKKWFGLRFESRVWVRILLADLEFKKKAWSLYNPKTGYTESLDDSIEVAVPQDDYGLYAIDILDPSFFIKCMHLTDVYHFHDMIDMLVGCGYKKGTTLFGFGYDFRQSNRIVKSMDTLKVKLETTYKALGGRKVNIIAHSMGGLLVSCFISLHRDVRIFVCKTHYIVMVFVVAVLAIFLLVPRNLSNRAYRLSLMGIACSSLYSLYSLYRKPNSWNLQAVQVWFQSVIATKDFIYFIYCLTFVTSQLSLKFALLPILCRALEHVAKFLRHNFSRSSLYRKYLEELCVWVESNTTTLSILSSQAEIGIGFLLIISLVSWQRNIIQTFMYWQLLKLMYHAPVTASYHQSVWVKIGRTVIPLVHHYVPFLNTPLSAVQRWWLR